MAKNVKKEIDRISFSTIPYKEKTVPVLTIGKSAGKEYMNYGNDNKFPQYLFELYTKSPVLSSIINGTCDYVMGDGLVSGELNVGNHIWNDEDETFEDIIKALVFDYMLYGGYALQVIYDRNGELKEIYHLDLMDLRVNEDCTKVYYCEEWGKWGQKYIEYPAFDPNIKSGTSIYYFKGHIARRNMCYPIPKYISALTDIETGTEISKFHLKSVLNNFSGSCMVNFNNGVPTPDVQDDIEEKINDKFSGADNAGKIIVSFNDNKDSAATIERVPEDNFDEKYQALMKTTRENIFVAFRATPNLFGLMNETTGFNKQEFAEAFELYNKTVVIPIQNDIIRTFIKILGEDNPISFLPFKLESENNEE